MMSIAPIFWTRHDVSKMTTLDHEEHGAQRYMYRSGGVNLYPAFNQWFTGSTISAPDPVSLYTPIHATTTHAYIYIVYACTVHTHMHTAHHAKCIDTFTHAHNWVTRRRRNGVNVLLTYVVVQMHPFDFFRIHV